MRQSLGSTCHGAGRAQSRNFCKKTLNCAAVQEVLVAKGICLRAASMDSISEEAPESYKDVEDVVSTCERAGISKKIVKLIPFCVIKG